VRSAISAEIEPREGAPSQTDMVSDRSARTVNSGGAPTCVRNLRSLLREIGLNREAHEERQRALATAARMPPPRMTYLHRETSFARWPGSEADSDCPVTTHSVSAHLSWSRAVRRLRAPGKIAKATIIQTDQTPDRRGARRPIIKNTPPSRPSLHIHSACATQASTAQSSIAAVKSS
jgi:hypothetical protein